MVKHIHIHIHTQDADPDGKWVTINGAHVFVGKGGKIEKGPSHLVGKTEAEAHGGKTDEAPFVTDLFATHKSQAGIKEHLATVAKEKLTKAAALLKGRTGEREQKVHALIEKELDDRASRGG